MPFESKSQQRFMFAKHPGIAKRWAHETPSIKKLPEKVKQAFKEVDNLKGGLADKKPLSAFKKKSLKEGAKEEKKEHTNKQEVAEEIASDHLTEDPSYYEKLKKMEKKSYVLQAFFDEVGNLTKKADGPLPSFPKEQPPPLPGAKPAPRKPLLPDVAHPKKQPQQASAPIKLPTSDKGVIERGKAYKNPGDIPAKRIQRGLAKAEARSQPKPATPKPTAKASPAKPGVAPKIKGKSGINMGHIGGAAALAAGMYAAHQASKPDPQQQY